MIPLLDLKTDDCRFPVADRLFCGDARREGSPYCAHHHARAYVPGTGSKGLSGGRFLCGRRETVPAAREAQAKPASPVVNDPTALLDQFVRAAAAARRDAPPPPPPPAAIARPVPRIVAVQAYTAPISSVGTHEAREYFYLHDLARQCDDLVAAISSRAIRGVNYAINMRDFVAGSLGMSIDELLCNRRTKDLVQVRQLAMFCVAKGALKLSMPDIGRRVFGGFDHTTVLHARDKIAAMLESGTLPARLAHVLERVCARDVEIDDAVRKARAAGIARAEIAECKRAEDEEMAYREAAE